MLNPPEKFAKTELLARLTLALALSYALRRFAESFLLRFLSVSNCFSVRAICSSYRDLAFSLASENIKAESTEVSVLCLLVDLLLGEIMRCDFLRSRIGKFLKPCWPLFCSVGIILNPRIDIFLFLASMRNLSANESKLLECYSIRLIV